MQSAELAEHRQQIERGKFVRSNRQFALLQFPHLDQCCLSVLPQIEQLFGVLLQHPASVGQHTFARGTVEERLANLYLKLSDSLADCRLGSEEFLCRSRKPALAGNRKEDFQLRKIHKAPFLAFS